jgi:hypothetical protein
VRLRDSLLIMTGLAKMRLTMHVLAGIVQLFTTRRMQLAASTAQSVFQHCRL